MKDKKKIDYKAKIVKILADSPSGLTITDISKESGFHRNTVSTYVRVLEEGDLVIKKKIGAAHLYFSVERKYLQRNLVNSFIKALLYGIKTKYPHQEQTFKEIGWKILDYFQFPLGNAYLKEFEEARITSNTKLQLKLFQEFYNSFDFFQDDLNLTVVELYGNRVTYRILNSEFLDHDFIYFYYIACGITEGVYLRNLNIKVECNVEEIQISNKDEDSYIDISLEIK